jgi:hypothetical protein
MGYNIFFGFDPLCSQINLDILMFYIKVFMLEKSKCKWNIYIYIYIYIYNHDLNNCFSPQNM